MNTPQRAIAAATATSPPPRLSLRQENIRLRQRIAELEQDNHALGATKLRRAQQNSALADAGRVLRDENVQMERTILRMDDRIAELKDERRVLERELENTRRKVVSLKHRVSTLDERLRGYEGKEGKGLGSWIRKVAGRKNKEQE